MRACEETPLPAARWSAKIPRGRPAPPFPPQTAGFSGPAGAELIVFCLAQPQQFRAAVLAAKRALSDGRPSAAGATALTGAPKLAAGGAVPDAGVAAIVTVLERLEAAVNEGLRELRASRAPVSP